MNSSTRSVLAAICGFLAVTVLTASCLFADEPAEAVTHNSGVKLIVLGIAQDAGFPQAGCKKICCAQAWDDESIRRNVVSLAVIDQETGQRWLFECTPDFPLQLRMLDERYPKENGSSELDGIFLTHAHIGHYAGLIHLGREVMGASNTPVYAMPGMSDFLKNNGPWSQLVTLENIALQPIRKDEPVQLNDRIKVTPFQVPHRDEFSETVGFRIEGPEKSVVFLPDIDKWGRWSVQIEDVIRACDYAYLDGTFFEDGELPGRDMASIPHPFVSESINRFSVLDAEQRSKVRFIHFNHTNPVLQPDSPASTQIQRAGMSIAEEGEVFDL
ncbi:MAG: MBL fold metallo-hydrolase [Planctomycetota bacterium]